jgi:ATP-binding cassette subfamily G (WHITE) protein 2 (SNQ2)
MNRTNRLLSIFFLFVFAMAIVTKAWFRALAAACKSEAMAQAFGGISVLMMSIYSGQHRPYQLWSSA